MYTAGTGGGGQGIFLKGAKFFHILPTHIIQDFLIFLLLNIREKTPVLVKYGQYDEVVK